MGGQDASHEVADGLHFWSKVATRCASSSLTNLGQHRHVEVSRMSIIGCISIPILSCLLTFLLSRVQMKDSMKSTNVSLHTRALTPSKHRVIRATLVKRVETHPTLPSQTKTFLQIEIKLLIRGNGGFLSSPSLRRHAEAIQVSKLPDGLFRNMLMTEIKSPKALFD